MIRITGCSSHGIEALSIVYGAMGSFDPTLLDHFDEAIVEVRFDRRCPGRSIACAFPDEPRVMMLKTPPEHVPLDVLGLALLHEAHHWQRGQDGRWSIARHTCSEATCSIPGELAADPIYAMDRELYPRVTAALYKAGYDAALPLVEPPPPRSPVVWLAVAALCVAVA